MRHTRGPTAISWISLHASKLFGVMLIAVCILSANSLQASNKVCDEFTTDIAVVTHLNSNMAITQTEAFQEKDAQTKAIDNLGTVVVSRMEHAKAIPIADVDSYYKQIQTGSGAALLWNDAKRKEIATGVSDATSYSKHHDVVWNIANIIPIASGSPIDTAVLIKKKSNAMVAKTSSAQAIAVSYSQMNNASNDAFRYQIKRNAKGEKIIIDRRKQKSQDLSLQGKQKDQSKVWLENSQIRR